MADFTEWATPKRDTRLSMAPTFNAAEANMVFDRPNAEQASKVLATELAKKVADGCVNDGKSAERIDTAAKAFEQIQTKLDGLQEDVRKWALDKKDLEEKAAAAAKSKTGTQQPAAETGSELKPPAEVESATAAASAPANSSSTTATPPEGSPSASENPPGIYKDAAAIQAAGKEFGARLQAVSDEGRAAEAGLKEAFEKMCDSSPGAVAAMMAQLKNNAKLKGQAQNILGSLQGFAKTGWGSPGGAGGAGGQPPGAGPGGQPPGGGGGGGGGSGGDENSSNGNQNGMGGMGMGGMGAGGGTPSKSSASSNTPKAPEFKNPEIRGAPLDLKSSEPKVDKEILDAIAKAGQPAPASKTASSGADDTSKLLESLRTNLSAILAKSATFNAPAIPKAAKRVPSYIVKSEGSKTPSRGVPSTLERTAVKRVK